MTYRDELEAAREEVEILLAKVADQEKELRTLRKQWGRGLAEKVAHWGTIAVMVAFSLFVIVMVVMFIVHLSQEYFPSPSLPPRSSSYTPPEITQAAVDRQFFGRLRKAGDRGHFYEFSLPQENFVRFGLSSPGSAGVEVYARGAKVQLRVLSAPEVFSVSLRLPPGVYRINVFGDPSYPFEGTLRILEEVNGLRGKGNE